MLVPEWELPYLSVNQPELVVVVLMQGELFVLVMVSL
jgi:hypothetical protein